MQPIQTQAMLSELHPFRDIATGRTRLSNLLNQVCGGNLFTHPVISWLDNSNIAKASLLFDLNRIEERMRWLKDLATAYSVTPLVAVKSCPHAEYMELAYKHLDGFDVSNQNEYAILADDLNGKLVSVTSPALEGDFGDFLTKGNSAVICLDSPHQLNSFFMQSPRTPYILRVQGSDLLQDARPADTAYYPATRFGFSVAELTSLFQHPQVKTNPPAGFHVHHGSERNQSSTYKTIIRALSKLVTQLSQPAKYINLGGGWHAMESDNIEETLRYARECFPLPCSILIEPGRWYASDAGFAVGTIVNQMQTGGIIKYTLNLSGKCHLHWSQAKLLHHIEAGCTKGCHVQFYGPSCYESDAIGQFLLPYRRDPIGETGLSPGKQVVFSGISTYSAAWNTAFNGVPRADVLWLRP